MIKAIRDLSANHINWLAGIISAGTGTFILTEMREGPCTFERAEAEARRWLRRSDPTFDVEGIDAAHN